MSEPQDPPGAPRRTAGLVAVVAGLVVTVLVVVLVRTRSADEPEASGPALTVVTIVSEPAGATVVRTDGGVLGVTPFEITLPKTNSELPVLVQLPGYQTRRSTIPLFSQTGRVDVALVANGAEAPAPPKPPPDGWVP